MSSPAKTAQSANAGNRRTGLPDERFWIKYSQNHELPLSVTSSLFLHALAVGFVGLVLAGLFAGLFTSKRAPQVAVFAMAEGGSSGDRNGTLESGDISIPTGIEAVKQSAATPMTPVDKKELIVPVPNQEPLVNSPDATAHIEIMAPRASKDLSDDIRRAVARLAAASAARESSGAPGKKGVGSIGDGEGGTQGKGNHPRGKIQEARKARWTLLFATSSPDDYLKQLGDLEAIIAIPQSNDKFLVFRDLKVRPFSRREENGGDLPRIQYSDDNQTTIAGLVRLFRLNFTPKFFMAFFPEKLELELRELEKKEFNGEESEIIQTYFQFERQANGIFKPKVKSIEVRKQ